MKPKCLYTIYDQDGKCLVDEAYTEEAAAVLGIRPKTLSGGSRRFESGEMEKEINGLRVVRSYENGFIPDNKIRLGGDIECEWDRYCSKFRKAVYG